MYPAIKQTRTPHEGRFCFFRQILVVFGGGCFLLAWLLPNHYPPWYSFYSESLMFLALIFFSFEQILYSPKILMPRYFVWWAGGVVLLILLQYSLRLIAFEGDAIISCIYVAAFLLALCLGCGHASRDAEVVSVLIPLAYLFVVAGIFSTWIALVQWLGIDSPLGFNLLLLLEPGARPYANLGQPNHLATLLLLSSVMVSILVIKKSMKPWQGGLAISFLSIGLALAASRSAWVSMFVLCFFYAFYGRRFFARAGDLAVGFWVLGVIAASALMSYLSAKLLLNAAGRAINLTQDSTRLTMWKQFWAAICESPYWGYGWRQTAVAQKTGAVFYPGSVPTDYAHNLIIDLLLWVGVPLAILFLGSFFYFFFKIVHRISMHLEFLLVAAIIPVLVHSNFEFPFSYSYFLLPVGWIFGAVILWQRRRCDSVRYFFDGRVTEVYCSFLVLFLVLCGFVWREYVLAEEDYRVMRFEVRSVGRTPSEFVSPNLFLLTQLREVMVVGRWGARRGMSEAEIDRMRMANLSFSWATLHLKFVVALALNNQVDKATQEMTVLRSIYGKTSYDQAVESVRQLFPIYPELKAIQF